MAETQEEKQAQEVAIDRMRAFEVGVAHLCKDAGIEYGAFAKAAATAAEMDPSLESLKGVTQETLGPKLVEAMVVAGTAQQGQESAKE